MHRQVVGQIEVRDAPERVAGDLGFERELPWIRDVREVTPATSGVIARRTAIG